jgi:hypothetical protein
MVRREGTWTPNPDLLGVLRRCRCCGLLSFEVKYGAQRDVDLHELLRVQAAREVAEALRVDRGGLLDQYPDILAEELDGGMDHGSEGLEVYADHLALGEPARPRRLNPNPRIKSPLLCLIILLELLSCNANTCRELPFCPVAGIRGALRIPDAAGAYRGIRANMEQTSMRIGLDHCVEDVEDAVGTGRGASSAKV